MNNLPPFYVGQRIVRIKNSSDSLYKIGDEHICYDCMQCGKCHKWSVDVGIKVKRWGYILFFRCDCGGVKEMKDSIQYFDATSFAPIEEKFQSITLEKVLEEETKLIGVN